MQIFMSGWCMRGTGIPAADGLGPRKFAIVILQMQERLNNMF